MDPGAEDPFDRNRSITSGHAAAAAAAAADLAMAHSSMRAFTESFPPGPQHLLSQVPWYLQLQVRDDAPPAALTAVSLAVPAAPTCAVCTP